MPFELPPLEFKDWLERLGDRVEAPPPDSTLLTSSLSSAVLVALRLATLSISFFWMSLGEKTCSPLAGGWAGGRGSRYPIEEEERLFPLLEAGHDAVHVECACVEV